MKTTKEKKGGIITKENFINFSNLMVIEKTKEIKKEKKAKA
jgi:ribosomal protein L24